MTDRRQHANSLKCPPGNDPPRASNLKIETVADVIEKDVWLYEGLSTTLTSFPGSETTAKVIATQVNKCIAN